LFKAFPISSPEDEHGHGHDGEEDKNIGFLGVDAPERHYLVDGNDRNGQVKVFGVL
jgi:hypothetical protein